MNFLQKQTLYAKEKWQHKGFQRYFQNFSWLLSGRLFTLAVAFFINIYMARYLGPGNYGVLNYIISFAALFDFISSLGIENIAGREIVKNHEKKDEIIGTSFYLKLAGSICAVILIVIASFVTTHDTLIRELLWIFSLNYLFSPLGIIDAYFKSQALSKYPTLVIILANSIAVLFRVIIMLLHGGLIWISLTYALETITLSFGLLYLFKKTGHYFRKWVYDKTTALIILRDSWPLMLSGVAAGIYLKIDQVMIKNMLGNEQAGIYAVSSKLAEFWYFVPNAIAAAVFPAIINAKKVSGELYKNRLLKLYSSLFWLALFVAIVTTLFAHPIVHLLFGDAYIGAVLPLTVYIWAGIGISLGFGLTNFIIAENTALINMIATISGAVINIVLNLIFIPLYGILGAAFASFISYSMVTIIMLVFEKSKTQYKLIGKAILLMFN